ncbi:hypothetical protein SLA2020_272650 [Shorea laevis]
MRQIINAVCLQDYDGKLLRRRLHLLSMYLKDALGKRGVQELHQHLSKDTDGKILVEDIVKLVVGKDANTPDDGSM